MLRYEERKKVIYINDNTIKDCIKTNVFEVLNLEECTDSISGLYEQLFFIYSLEKESNNKDYEYLIKYEKNMSDNAYIQLPNKVALQGFIRILEAFFNLEVHHPIGTEFKEQLLFSLEGSLLAHKYLLCGTEYDYRENIGRFVNDVKFLPKKACLALRYGTNEGSGNLFWLHEIGCFVNELIEARYEGVEIIYFPFSYSHDDSKSGIVEIDIFITGS
ncbi:hypothetical protein PRVXT_001560 [Proteinivorax tanatarense]|uniref:Uncharacterized protein n=1 Tax=Proteinivorax tanatarense TaxID=1260629 RepID=A0AAU7VID2_9FIRM